MNNIDKSLDQESLIALFSQFGTVEELYCFKDQSEQFKGSLFLRYQARKEALKAIQMLNWKGMADNRYSAQLVDKMSQGQVIDLRFADKRRTQVKECVGGPAFQ